MPQQNPFGEWGGYMDVKISKLESQVANSTNFYKQSNLFEGISIFVNGWTNPTADDLKRIMMTYGGTYHHYERKTTTYIVAENLPDVKIRNMNTSNVISPKWVVDCVKANKILDYSKYLLYTNQKRSQPGLFFKNASFSHDNSFNKSHTKPNELNLKRKISSITDEHDLTAIKSKIKFDLVENDDSENEDNPNTIDNFEDKKCIVLKEKKNESICNANNELEILNNCLVKKSEIKSETDSLDKKVLAEQNKNTSKIARNANDPKFLSEFYNNSRLHHIATLGSGFKQYVTELKEAHTGEFPAREKLKCLNKMVNFSSTPTVMHIDMDCFFVSVGLRSYPQYIGFPVAVTHSKGGAEVADRAGVDRQQESDLYMKRLENRLQTNIMSDKQEKIKTGFDGKESLSEIASCSYEAREKGIKNGMFVGQALKLCPELKTIPYDFEGYKEVAFHLYDTIAQYTLDIEAVSCDEMFVDLTNLLNAIKVDAMDFVSFVRNEVKLKTQCSCSAGVGSNRLQARMATKKAKPNGQFYLDSDTVLEYMANIPIKNLPGVGYSTECALKQLSLVTCGDLQKLTIPKLQMEFGKKFGETLYQFCRGIDNKPLVYGQIRKSVSAEVNYGIRFTDIVEMEKFLKQLCQEVHSRLMNIKRKGKCITLKVMVRAKEAPIETAKFMGHGFCDSINKSVSLSDYTCDLETITRTVLTTMKALNIDPKELRGIGIQINKLDDPNDAKKNNVLKNMFSKVIEKQKEKQSSTNICNQNVNQFTKSPEKLQSKQQLCSPIKRIDTIKFKTPDKLDRNASKKSSKTPEKSVTSKGRGKTSNTKTNVATKQSGDILSMFQNAAKKQTVKQPIQQSKAYRENEIDPAVLSELPIEIQREILNENQISIKTFSSSPKNLRNSKVIQQNKEDLSEKLVNKVKEPEQIEIDLDFLNALPENLRLEIENDIAKCKNKNIVIKSNLSNPTNLIESVPSTSRKISNVQQSDDCSKIKNIFLDNQPIKFIKDWINDIKIPKQTEIDKFCRNIRNRIRMNDISCVEKSVLELHRILSQMDNCQWHEAYKTIIENLQEEMNFVYGERMQLNDRIECDDCN